MAAAKPRCGFFGWRGFSLSNDAILLRHLQPKPLCSRSFNRRFRGSKQPSIPSSAPTRPSFPSRRCFLLSTHPPWARCRDFAVAFGNVHKNQKRWLVPSLELREELRISASITLVNAVVIDNESCKNATVIQVDSANKQGILLEVVQVLTDLNLMITKAYICSYGGWFMDVFNVTDNDGNKIKDEGILDYIQKSLGPDSCFASSRRRSVGVKTGSDHTSIELIGSDRPGLLSEVSAVLTNLKCNVVNAEVWTHNTRAAAVMQVTDETEVENMVASIFLTQSRAVERKKSDFQSLKEKLCNISSQFSSVLGEALKRYNGEDEGGRIRESLEKFGRERRRRSFDLVNTAYMVGFMQQSDGDLMQFLRDKLMARFLGGILLKKTSFDCGNLTVSSL